MRVLREDVAEMNGEDGRAWWGYLGRDVFDLTGKSTI